MGSTDHPVLEGEAVREYHGAPDTRTVSSGGGVAAGLPGEAMVGPNAIIQTYEALRWHCGEPVARLIMREAGLSGMPDNMPAGLVGAASVRQLARAMEARVDAAALKPVWEDAGCRTGHYILENRIPRAARALLVVLPASLSARLLLSAVLRNSWTFAGHARVTGQMARAAILDIEDNPLPRPGRWWHKAVFKTLFSQLVTSDIRVDCSLMPATSLMPARDRFVIDFRRAGGQ